MNNKKILVAGAGGLLGSKVVNALLDTGNAVVALDLDLDAMASKLNSHGCDLGSSNLELSQFNITNEAEVKRFFVLTTDLDGAVNCTYPRNARYGAHFFDVTFADFNENMSLHLGSAFLFAQQCAAYFKRSNRPFSLVNISSIYGVVAPKFSIYNDTAMTMPVEYAAIKSALIHLNKYIVNYMSNSLFRVNSVSPGGLFDNQPEAFVDAYKQHTHGKGMLNADDVIGAIIFLLSERSKYINGQNIIVDDGFCL